MSPERDVRSRTAGVGTQKFISPFLISLISARKSWQPPGAVRYGVSNRAKRFQPSTRAKPPSSLSCESPLAPPCSHTSFNPPSHVSSSLSLSLSFFSSLASNSTSSCQQSPPSTLHPCVVDPVSRHLTSSPTDVTGGINLTPVLDPWKRRVATSLPRAP